MLKQISDLMVVIRKNTQPSSGIDTFEKLLKELSEDSGSMLLYKALPDMNRFIEYFMILKRNVDLVEDLTIKANLLTSDFIHPHRFFRDTYHEMTRILKNLKSTNLTLKKNITYNIGKRNILGNLPKWEEIKPELLNPAYIGEEEKVYERFRKEILLWNYFPNIVKALIMTKRRELGLDKNSKHFG